MKLAIQFGNESQSFFKLDRVKKGGIKGSMTLPDKSLNPSSNWIGLKRTPFSTRRREGHSLNPSSNWIGLKSKRKSCKSQLS